MSKETKEVVCELIRADVPTANGHIYSKEALERAVEQFNHASKRGTCFVVKDAESDGRVLLNKVVARVHETQLRDGQLVCQVETLQTPVAKDIELLLQHGTITPIAYGSTNNGKVDPNDLRVVGFTYVYNGPKK
jgi:hypothetical protein